MVNNLLHIIETTGPGGAETVFLNLIHHLKNKRFKPHIVLKKRKGWLYDELIKSGIIPAIIKSEWPSFDLKHLLKLILFTKKNKIDLIHSHLFGSNVYCCMVGLVCGVPVISTFHGMADVNTNDKFLNLKFKLINKGSKKIVFVSEHLKKFYFKSPNIDKTKSIVIYNGINFSQFEEKSKYDLRTELGYSKEDILIGSIGNIRKPKGYDVLLKAAAIVKQKHPECRFIVAGEGDNQLFKELLVLRKSLKVEDTVNFLGFRTDVSRILKNLDVFLLPSTTEGFSISTIEAMASGVPVIVTDSGGPREIVTNNKDGIVVPPNDAEAIASAVQKYLSCNKTAVKLAKQAKTTVRKSFSMEKMIGAYTSLYEKVLN